MPSPRLFSVLILSLCTDKLPVIRIDSIPNDLNWAGKISSTFQSDKSAGGNTMTSIQKSALRDRMQRELDTLHLSLSSIQTPLRCPDENELASRISECTLSEHLNHRLCVRISALEEALRRMDVEDYGICADCGEPIPFPRLLAAPDVTLCISCQTEQDQKCQHHSFAPVLYQLTRLHRVEPHIHPLPYPETGFRLPDPISARKKIRKAGRQEKLMQSA